MISVAEATRSILEYARSLPQQQAMRVDTLEGRVAVAQESVIASADFPPFDRVAMDGYALKHHFWEEGQRRSQIQGVQPAGVPAHKLLGNGCIEVMTGAVLPEGADTVVRYEDTLREGTEAVLAHSVEIKLGQHVHARGSDRPLGCLLMEPGQILTPPHWGVLATLGLTSIRTQYRPRISLVGTGDELVPIDQIPESFQIRASNSVAMAAALRDFGYEGVKSHLVGDDPKALEAVLAEALNTSDICIITGGVSAGKFDHIPKVLKNLNVQEVFHKIRQRPGKPLFFGHKGSGMGGHQSLVFGLPGNPISTLVCLYRYVLPALKAMLRTKEHSSDSSPPVKCAQLTEDLRFGLGQDMTLFTPVRIFQDPQSATIMAQPCKALGSGDLGSLLVSDGFIECPEGQTLHPRGSVLSVYPWRA